MRLGTSARRRRGDLCIHGRRRAESRRPGARPTPARPRIGRRCGDGAPQRGATRAGERRGSPAARPRARPRAGAVTSHCRAPARGRTSTASAEAHHTLGTSSLDSPTWPRRNRTSKGRSRSMAASRMHQSTADSAPGIQRTQPHQSGQPGRADRSADCRPDYVDVGNSPTNRIRCEVHRLNLESCESAGMPKRARPCAGCAR